MFKISKDNVKPDPSVNGSSLPYKRNINHHKPESESLDNNNFDSINEVDKRKSNSNPNGKRLFGIELQGIFDKSEAEYIEGLLLIRVAAFLIWTASILYASYHVYLACEVNLGEKFQDPELNPGPFTGLFNRGKDATDFEWEMFSLVYLYKLWLWYGVFVIGAIIAHPNFHKQWQYVSFFISIVMFLDLVGLYATIFLLVQPAIYWAVANIRSKLLMWSVTVAIIYGLNAEFIKVLIPEDVFAEYFCVVASAWNCCRCISFCCDIWNRNEDRKVSLKYLGNVIIFCFYLPLTISGPLVTYNTFEKCILKKDTQLMRRRDKMSDLMKLLKTLLRLGLLAIFTESVLHFLYFRSLALTYIVHRRLSLWAICGTIYWLGQFFSMKYKLLYGFPSCVAEFDGLEMPTLPTCPSYMHRYSALWRDFDNGLYRFLVNYIYVPVLTWVQKVDKNKKLPLDAVKLIASFTTFVYVFMWHSLTFDVFIWTALNFIGISIERLGSIIKREIDRRTSIDPLIWDFIVEPIVTVPLAAMSILNSSIFCGNLSAARSFAYILWKKRADSWVFLFLYFFTHTAVTHRTWRHKLSKLISKILNRNRSDAGSGSEAANTGMRKSS